jgi:hypothetical protein
MEQGTPRPRRMLGALLFAGVVLFALTGVAQAGPYTIGTPSLATGPSPFSPGCGGPGEGVSTSFNFPDTEVEPWVAVDPTDPTAQHIVAFWQQDRWSDGGAHGLVAGVTDDGGATWTTSIPEFSRCAGAGPGDPGYFERSSDPWLSFSPNGNLYAIAIATDFSTARNAVLVSRSTDGGDSWEEPITLRFDRSRSDVPLGTNFNDKETITADPNDSSFAYAVWDRLVFPSSRASAAAQEHNKFAFRGPTWFARTTNGGASWERARPIFDPGEQNQTISNQIVVLPNGDLVDGFTLIRSHRKPSLRGNHVAVIRSRDHGETWSKPTIVARLGTVGISDPEPVNCRPFIPGNPPCTLVRTGDIVPDFAVDDSGGPNDGNVYAVWQENHSSPFGDDAIMLSRSTDGGTSWSAPVQVNDTPSGYNAQAFTAAVDVRDDGDVAVTYYDMRDDVAGDSALDTDYWIAHSHDAGATWSGSQQLTGPFDMRSAPYARGYFVGDYEGLDNAAGATGPLFRPFWVEGNGDQAFDALNKSDGFLSSAR